MSTRRNMYLGSGPRYSGGGGDDDIGWLWQLLGMDKTEGGPTVDAETGKVVFSPYSGNNFVSRKVASRKNEAILPDLYRMQQEADLELGLERERQKGSQKNIKIQGKQQRKTQAERAAQDNDATLLKAKIDQMVKRGIPATMDNFIAYDKLERQNSLKSSALRNKIDLGILQDKDTQQAMLEGAQASARMPVGELSNKLDMKVGAGDMLVRPSWNGKSEPSTLLGSSQEPDSLAMTGGIPMRDPSDPSKIILAGQKPEVLRGGSRPGVFKQGLNPQDIEARKQKFKANSGISEGEEIMQQSAAGTLPQLNLGNFQPPAQLPQSFDMQQHFPAIAEQELRKKLNSPFLSERMEAQEQLKKLKLGLESQTETESMLPFLRGF